MSHDRTPPTDSTWIQLAVAGEIGPVVRTALLPYVAPQPRRCTVLRLGAPAGVDLLAVMEALDAEGLNVTGVRCVAGDARGRSPVVPGDR
jgi:hypothetical protein